MLSDDAKELLALDKFLGELSDVHILVAVRQRRPKTLEEAVSTILEMESYVTQGQGKGESKISSVDAGDKTETTCEVGNVRLVT